MPALDEDGTAADLCAQATGCGEHRVLAADLRAEQDLGLGKVGRRERGKRKQSVADGRDGVVAQVITSKGASVNSGDPLVTLG